MKTINKGILFICFALLYIPAFSAPPQFKTDISQLSLQKGELYFAVEKIINEWSKRSGGYEKLVAAGAMIDSFIKSDPDFLPIYIEKARLTIMVGAIGANDFAMANRDALVILADVQKKDANYAKSYVLAGHAYINVRDFDNAKKSLEYAERIGTIDPWLYNNWADLLGRIKQYDKALTNARKALILSGDNSKAMVSAIYFISENSKFSSNPSRNSDIAHIVFESVKDPEQRMRIASRLLGGYDGNSDILRHAYAMIDRQSKETPHLEAVDLAMVEWLLKKGYLRDEHNIPRYDPEFSSAAEKILDSLAPSRTTNDRIFSYKFAIALSNGNLIKASQLLAEAEAGDVPRTTISTSKALMMWSLGDYESVIKILEKLAETDPTFADDALLMTAYVFRGRTDLLAAHHKRLVDRYPTNAWILGNYASFLLFTNDIDGAINYGDKALEQMNYPIARNTTALAYLMKASTLQRAGSLSSAKHNLGRAISIGFDEGYVLEHCDTYCSDIRKMLGRP
jgi:tetratricopeptide (TPR) repeat protein